MPPFYHQRSPAGRAGPRARLLAMPATKFSSVSAIDAESDGWGFFLCARKEVRAGRSGSYMALQLQDATGQIEGKVFQDVERLQLEFGAGDFVKVQGRGNRFKDRTELLVDKIRRVDPAQDAAQGFSESACVQSAPRSDDEMWRALTQLVESVENTFVRTLLARILETHEEQLRRWPAAQTVHHAYRSGLLEHILKVADVATALASAYNARSRPGDCWRHSARHRQAAGTGLRRRHAVLTRRQPGWPHRPGCRARPDRNRKNRRLSRRPPGADRASDRIASRIEGIRIAGRAADRGGIHPGGCRRPPTRRFTRCAGTLRKTRGTMSSPASTDACSARCSRGRTRSARRKETSRSSLPLRR